MPASDELQDEVTALDADGLLKDAPELRPAGTLRFRERQAVMDAYEKLMGFADDEGNVTFDPANMGGVNALLADIDEALERYAVNADAYVKWSAGRDAPSMFALFGRYGGEVAKLFGSAS